ncbi:MAG: hypothetical protein M3400_05735 [Actinomycetota bacterium]|nr:hypothetical protein [Actinomycetota bacterium]
MSEDFVGLAQADALGRGSTELDSSAARLFQNLQALISELESDQQAIRGGALQAFARVKSELFERFHELVAFCRANGMRLSDAQIHVDATDQAGSDEFSAARTAIAGIASRMSA